MRIAHIADSHLGYRAYGRTTPNGTNVREQDLARAFSTAVDGVIAARPDVVIHAGDLFHGVRPPNAAVEFAFAQFARMKQALGCPIVLIAGNHDTRKSADDGSPLTILRHAGVDVAAGPVERFTYPALDLTVTCVPHPALIAGGAFRPDGSARHQVLVLHGEVVGVFPKGHAQEYGGAEVMPDLLGGWSYVALGHYHVQHEVRLMCWYAGGLDYCTTNIWGELADEARLGVPGKGWLCADLEARTVERHCLRTRPIHELPPIHAVGLTAEELNAEIANAVARVPLKDAIVRLKVLGVPKPIARLLDHRQHRQWKAEALHFDLKVQTIEATPAERIARLQSLDEMVGEKLRGWALPPGMDRDAFVRLGTDVMQETRA